MKKIALLGYSGHAFVVADAILKNGDHVFGYFEKTEANFNPFDLKYLGSEKEKGNLESIRKNAIATIVGIGDNKIRKRLINFLIEENLPVATVIHPASIIGSLVTIGNGCFFAAGAKINSMAVIGEGAILNTGCIFEHECRIGEYVHIAPGAVLAGNVYVGSGSFIGAGAVIKQGVSIGKNVVVGAGSVVLKDVPDFQVWAGNPAKELKK